VEVSQLEMLLVNQLRKRLCLKPRLLIKLFHL